MQFVGKTGAQNARERMDGFKETVGEAFEEKARMPDDGDARKAGDRCAKQLPIIRTSRCWSASGLTMHLQLSTL